MIAPDSVPTSVDRLALPTRTDGRTDGLTKNRLTERTSGTFRNAHTRVPDFDAGEVAETPEPPHYEQLWKSAIGALRLLGRQVRSLRAEVEALRGEPK